MNAFNAAVTQFFQIVLAPFASYPLAGLLTVSAVTGMAMTWAFGKTSHQRALRRVADQSRAQLLAIRLFRDDLTVTLRCQKELLRLATLRLLHSLPPMLVMAAPLGLFLVQLSLYYAHYALRPGDVAVVELSLAPDAWERFRDVKLEAPNSVTVETEGLRDRANRTVYWRIRPKSSEPATLRWRVGDVTIEKQLAVADAPQRLQLVSVRRPGPGFFDRLLHPAEAGFSAGTPVVGVEVHYRDRQTPIWGLHLPWWLTFFMVSMVVALMSRRGFRVSF